MIFNFSFSLEIRLVNSHLTEYLSQVLQWDWNISCGCYIHFNILQSECHSPEPLKQPFLSQQQSSKPAWIRWEGHHKYYIESEAFAVNSAGTIPASHWERFLGNRKLSGVCNNFWSDIEIFNIPYYTTGSRILMETLHTVAFNRKQSLCSSGGICKIIFLFLFFFFFLITSDFSYFF